MEKLQRGQQVMLNEALNVIEASDFEIQGEVVVLKEVHGGRNARCSSSDGPTRSVSSS